MNSSPFAVPHEPKVTRLTGEGGGLSPAAARNFTNPELDRAPEKHAISIDSSPQPFLKAQAGGFLVIRPDLHAEAHSVLRSL